MAKKFESLEVDSKKNAQVITAKSSTIRTLDAALKEAAVDLKEWEVERHVINKWDVAAKNKEKKLEATELWQIKIWLKRRIVKSELSAMDAFEQRMKNWKPLPKFEPKYKVRGSRHLLEVSLFDSHFGKLAWGPETGNDYDVRISEHLYLNAVEDLLAKVGGYTVEQILYPIGNDFFHVNNWNNTTEKGTQQDVDTRMTKIFELGCAAVCKSIDRCLQIAPVNIIWVPGNHDPETSWYMAQVIKATYRNNPSVRVNADPGFRKYVGYGTNLLGFTHGNEEPHRDLPTLMATEQPDLWAKSTNRVWHIGHFHKKAETRFLAGDTFNGVSVQTLPSLSGTDSWHYRKGYVKGNRAAEAYLWNFETGYVGHFNANARV